MTAASSPTTTSGVASVGRPTVGGSVGAGQARDAGVDATGEHADDEREKHVAERRQESRT